MEAQMFFQMHFFCHSCLMNYGSAFECPFINYITQFSLPSWHVNYYTHISYCSLGSALHVHHFVTILQLGQSALANLNMNFYPRIIWLHHLVYSPVHKSIFSQLLPCQSKQPSHLLIVRCPLVDPPPKFTICHFEPLHHQSLTALHLNLKFCLGLFISWSRSLSSSIFIADRFC